MAFDEKDAHAQEFTDIERQVLRVWFDVDLAGNDQLADAILNAGLQLEHYNSTLAHDPDKRIPSELNRLQVLAFKLSEQLSLAEAFLQEHKKYTARDRVLAFKDKLGTRSGRISEAT